MKELNFALIGGGFMGKAHSLGLAGIPMYCWPPPAMPNRAVIAELNSDLAETARQRFGFARGVVGWEEAVQDPHVDVVDIVVPNYQHKEVALAAFAAGKHVTCEKPLAVNAADAKEMWEAASASGLKSQVAFNWRLTPAVQMAKRLVNEGTLGQIRWFRGFWLADFGMDPDAPITWRHQRSLAGSGALGDLGSHIVDMARFLVGEITEVCGYSETIVKERPVAVEGSSASQKMPVDVDEETSFMVRFETGAHGFLESSWIRTGRKAHCGFELHGDRGAITFDWERMNELHFYSGDDPGDRQGFRTVLVGPAQPFGQFFWPIPGYQIGFAETKTVQLYDMVNAIVTDGQPQTTFYDGWKNCQVLDAVIRSVSDHGWVAM